MTSVVVLAMVVLCAACGQTSSAHSAVATTQPAPPGSSAPAPSGPLTAPKASVAQDAQFFTDVTEADPALVTYEQQQGNVALRALLTDGTAFCAFLRRGGGIDNALVAVGAGARSDESQTHLPLSVTTFNAIESVALLTLCPSYQKLLPASARAKIHDLGQALASRSS
jgi:hypothetical protein